MPLEALCDALLELIVSELTVATDLSSLGRASRTFARVVGCGRVWRAALARAGGVVRGGCARLALRQLTMLEGSWRTRGAATDARRAAARGPCARTGHAAFACHDGRTLVVFGGARARGDVRDEAAENESLWGEEGALLGDCWAFDVASGAWFRAATADSPPSPRVFSTDDGGGGAAVLRDASGLEFALLHGGLRAGGFRDGATFVLGPLGAACDAARWRWVRLADHHAAPAPEPRFHHRITALGGAPATAVAVSGGHDYALRPLLGVAVLSLRGVKLCPAVHAPSAALAAAAAPALCERALRSLRWRSWRSQSAEGAPEPPPRAHHAAASWRRHLVLFGGLQGRRFLADTWLLDTVLGGWTQLRLLPCGGRARAASVVVGDLLLVCGGVTPSAGALVELGDLWALDLAEPARLGWTRVGADALPSPPRLPRAGRGHKGSALAALHGGRTLLLFGGRTTAEMQPAHQPPADVHEPTEAWAFRLCAGGALGGGPSLARSVRCGSEREVAGLDVDVVASRARAQPSAFPASFAVSDSGGDLLACFSHVREDRMVVAALCFHNE